MLFFGSTVGQAQNAFRYVEKIDAITDEDTSYVWTGTQDVHLVWRCNNNDVEIFAVPDDYISSNGATVVFRFDKDQPVQTNWSTSTKGTAVFAPDRIIKGFTASAMKSDKVIFRIYDYNNTPIDVSYSLLGSEQALNKLKCVTKLLNE